VGTSPFRFGGCPGGARFPCLFCVSGGSRLLTPFTPLFLPPPHALGLWLRVWGASLLRWRFGWCCSTSGPGVLFICFLFGCFLWVCPPVWTAFGPPAGLVLRVLVCFPPLVGFVLCLSF
jgi:hypothetical protein